MAAIPGLQGLPPRELLGRTWHEFNDDDVLTYSAALAYHAILALFPFLLFLLALVSFLNVPQVFDRLLEWSRAVLPPDGMQQIYQVVEGFRAGDQGGLLSLGMIGAVWAASGGVRSTMNALNNAYDVEEARPAWRRYLVSIAFTLMLGLLVLVAMAFMLIGPRAAAWIAGRIGMADTVLQLWVWARFPVAIATLIVVSAVIYSSFPNVRGFRLLTPGSFFAVIVWLVLSIGFQTYLTHFGRYHVLYGSVGAVIVLLLYLWLSSIVLLVGGEINAVIAHARAEREGRSGEPLEV